MINDRWCNNSTFLHRPYYLPEEFESVILAGVYIPPTQVTEISDRAINESARHISSLERDHPAERGPQGQLSN